MFGKKSKHFPDAGNQYCFWTFSVISISNTNHTEVLVSVHQSEVIDFLPSTSFTLMQGTKSPLKILFGASLILEPIHIYLNYLHLQVGRLTKLIDNSNMKTLLRCHFCFLTELKVENANTIHLPNIITNLKSVWRQQNNQIGHMKMNSSWVQTLRRFLRFKIPVWVLWKLLLPNQCLFLNKILFVSKKFERYSKFN